MSDLLDTARQQIDRYGHTTKGTSLALVNEMQQLEAKIEQYEQLISKILGLHLAGSLAWDDLKTGYLEELARIKGDE